MKKVIRLTESDLHSIVKQSVNRILKESIDKIDDIYESVYDLDGEYYVYTGEESVTAIIDTEIDGAVGIDDGIVATFRLRFLIGFLHLLLIEVLQGVRLGTSFESGDDLI